ncbi:MAG: tetratricopeptide repeat protein [Myxococcota bacterium]
MTETATSEALPPGYHFPILVDGTQIGLCRGAIEIGSEMKLWFPTEAEVTVGHYMPLKIGPVDGREPVATMCRVAKVQPADGINHVYIGLSNTDAKLLTAIAQWFPERPSAPASPAASVAAHAPAPGLEASTELDLSDLAEPLSAPKKSAVNNEVLRFQYDSLLGEANSFEANGQHEEAFKRIEKALEIYPVNAEDLHIRLAKLAMASNQLGVALEHAESAKRLNPSRRDAEHLVRTIHGERSSRTMDRDSKKLNQELRSRRVETLKAVALVVFVILPALAYNIWTYAIPHGPRPTPLEASQFQEIVATTKVLRLDKIIYVFVGDSWNGIAKDDKTRILTELEERANLITPADRIVVTTAEPRLLAMRYKGRSKIYR